MGACEDLGRKVDGLAGLDEAALPAWVMHHLAGCPTCTRSLKRARLMQGLLATAREGPEPPADFAQRVLATLPTPRMPGATDPELWRLGWGLVPAFAATAVLVLALFQFEARMGSSSASLSPSLVPLDTLSASESLTLGAGPPDLDLVLAAVMERDGR